MDFENRKNGNRRLEKTNENFDSGYASWIVSRTGNWKIVLEKFFRAKNLKTALVANANTLSVNNLRNQKYLIERKVNVKRTIESHHILKLEGK